MLISIVEQLNLSGTVNSLARVGYYNGFSNKLSKVVFVDEMVLAFYPVGGTVYITYGQKLGFMFVRVAEYPGLPGEKPPSTVKFDEDIPETKLFQSISIVFFPIIGYDMVCVY